TSHCIRQQNRGRQVSAPETPNGLNGAAPAEIPLTPLPRDPAWNIFDLILVALFGTGSLFLCGFVGLRFASHLPAFYGVTREQIANNPLFLVPLQAVAYLLAFLFTRMLITVRAQE